jgi:hypothetical protein
MDETEELQADNDEELENTQENDVDQNNKEALNKAKMNITILLDEILMEDDETLEIDVNKEGIIEIRQIIFWF